MFKNHLSPDPRANSAKSVGGDGCPEIWELDNSDLAIISIDVTEVAGGKLAPITGCGWDEKIAHLPRNVLPNTRRELGVLT